MKLENEKSAHQASTMREHLEGRIVAIEEWLKESHPNCFVEQAHLDAGTDGRAYWHYGYIVALQDALALISENEATLH